MFVDASLPYPKEWSIRPATLHCQRQASDHEHNLITGRGESLMKKTRRVSESTSEVVNGHYPETHFISDENEAAG